MKNTSMSRRCFMKSTAAAVSVLGLPAIVPSTVFGADAPSNKVKLGVIGYGSMGSGNTGSFLGIPEVRVTAICDLDQNRMNNGKNNVDRRYGNQDCKTYHDFREMLAKEDLDAVTIAVPDHWHALPAIAAAKAGLDIYGEKPLARSIREGRAICDAVHRYGRVWQTGSWQRSQQNFRRGAELVRNGVIGKVRYIEVGLPTGGGGPIKPVQSPPPELDWEFWLGPAPKVPYRGVHHWDWRWIMDYSGGQLTDWAGHHIDIAHWGMGWDKTGPVRLEGKGEYANDGMYNVPLRYRIECEYADGTQMIVADGTQKGQFGNIPMGTRWVGDNGWVYVDRGGVIKASNPEILRTQIGPNGIHLYETNNHHRNFVECVKSRKETITPVETALRSISVGLLCEIAMLTERSIRWNPQTEEIIGDPQASALLGRAYREPWVL